MTNWGQNLQLDQGVGGENRIPSYKGLLESPVFQKHEPRSMFNLSGPSQPSIQALDIKGDGQSIWPIQDGAWEASLAPGSVETGFPPGMAS